jgi:pectate lyase
MLFSRSASGTALMVSALAGGVLGACGSGDAGTVDGNPPRAASGSNGAGSAGTSGGRIGGGGTRGGSNAAATSSGASAGRGGSSAGDATGGNGAPGGAGNAGGGAGGRGATSGGAAGLTATGGAPAAGNAAVGGAPGTGSGGGHAGASGASGTSGGAGTAGSGGGSCSEPPPASPLVGWASEPGAGDGGTSIATTTGGGSTAPVTVTTLDALKSAAAGSTPAVIYVKGKLAAGSVKIGSNKTIAGICGAELHGHVDMSGSVNVIFRNLKVVGYDCSDTTDGCKNGADAITVVNGAHHIWFDHCDISDGSDGNLDITNGSDFVTVSWTKFWYSSKRTDAVTGTTGHRFSNLIGAADGLAEDVGHLNVTWHHDWWADNVAERMPRSRDGKIHVVNNLFTASGDDYCTNSGNLSSLLVENNIYKGVSDPLQEDDDGNMLARGNVFSGTTGTQTANGTGFTPPYALTPDPTADLEATIKTQAGPH